MGINGVVVEAPRVHFTPDSVITLSSAQAALDESDKALISTNPEPQVHPLVTTTHILLVTTRCAPALPSLGMSIDPHPHQHIHLTHPNPIAIITTDPSSRSRHPRDIQQQ
jgi:hypothetical protein